MRKLVVVLTALLCAALTQAQTPTAGNVFIGYSYYNSDVSPVSRASFNGWDGSLEGKIFPGVGIVADLSGVYGSPHFVNPAATCAIGAVCTTTFSSHLYNVLFGPRFSFSVGKFRPFGEVALGVGHAAISGGSTSTGFATAVGGGLDYKIIRPVAWRFEGDYVSTHLYGNTQNNVRLSTGIVLRF